MKKLIILVTFLGLMSISYGQNPIQVRLSTDKVSTAIATYGGRKATNFA
jgi:hypothetical protein